MLNISFIYIYIYIYIYIKIDSYFILNYKLFDILLLLFDLIKYNMDNSNYM